MKKGILLILAVVLALSTFAFTACKWNPIGEPCVTHVDENRDHICDECEEVASICEDQNKDHLCDICRKILSVCEDTNSDHLCEHCGGKISTCLDETNDHKCDICGEVLSTCLDETNDHACDYCGEVISTCIDETNDHKCDICGEVLSTCLDETNDHKCDICGEVLSACLDETNDHMCDVCGEKVSDCIDENKDHACDICGAVSECVDTDGYYYCDVCGKDLLPANMERVGYALNISDLEAGALDRDLINGRFTIVSGSEIRNRTKTFEGVEYNKSVKIGNKTTKIKVSAPGAGQLSFLVQNGSSGATRQFITVTAPDGTTQDIEFAGTDEGSPVVKITINVTEGEWIISRGKNGGTQDVFHLELSCAVEKASEVGFEIVDNGIVDYLCGQTLDFTKLVVNGVYANGKTEPVAVGDLTIDSSSVNMEAAGTYAVTVKYKEYAEQTFNVNVYQPDSVELGFDATVQKGQSSAGNGLYVNQSFKEVYAIGEELDLTGLSVMVVGVLDGQELTFSLGNNYEVSSVDFSTAGTKVITISYTYGDDVKVSTTVNVHVVDTAPSLVDNVYQVKVDASYEGAIGAVSGGYNMFTTVEQALNFLAKVDQSKQKLMVIEEGLYTEKVEITIPNLHIKGAGADKVTIEWNSLYGIKDAGGFSQVTDSTQTVAVRDTATNVTIEGVTISNYWNSQERMDEAGLAIERGLALLVMADKFIMKDSALLGIQDTLELFTGRQYFENVFISGYTDFIFGTNNTTYFTNCTIHVIDTTKDDSGTAGYLTAFKGSNKGAQDAITYGAIFDNCKFTADAGVTAGKTAIGRTWGAYAAVAVINSELGGHISLDGYDPSNNKNKRYISMNGIHPTDGTVQFVEYGNTGAGAIAEAVAGMKMLTAEEAANYADFAVIFGKNNRGVTYLDAWDPTSTEIEVDDRTYYNFDNKDGASGQVFKFDTTTTITKGTAIEWEGLTISAENGNVAWNANASALNMKSGAFIKFSVAAGTEVTIVTYPNYNFFTLNGVATASADKLSQYYAEATEVTLLSTGDLYLYQIIINPGEEEPVAPTLTEIKVKGLNLNYVVGDTISYDGVEVLAYYSDNSIVPVTGYNIADGTVDMTAAGEYQIAFEYEGLTATVTVIVEDPNASPAIIKDTVLDFTSADSHEAVKNNPKVTLEGSFRDNGAECQIKGTVSFLVLAGTTVEVTPYGNSSYVSYTLGREGEADLVTQNGPYSVTFNEDCRVVYTGLDNNYLKSISIKCPIAPGKYVFGGASVEGDVTGILASVDGLTISGTCKTHSGGAQLGQNSLISFTAPAFTSVTIKGFDTSYGQLNVLVGGEAIAMDANACYVFTTSAAAKVEISSVNVGTEDAPAYNKSYITYIDVQQIAVIGSAQTISFGSNGNYKDSVIDFGGITIGDNGGNNSQIKNGSFSFGVKAGAVLTVNGYPSYTSYNIVVDGEATAVTDTTYQRVFEEGTIVTISHTEGNNYFYSFSVNYAIEENIQVTFGSAGNYKESCVDFAGITINDNGGNNSQIKNGSFILVLKAGATLTINGYPSYTSYNVIVGGETTAVTDTTYTRTFEEAVIVTISHTEGNNYFYSFSVNYPMPKEDITVTFGSEGNYKDSGIDFSGIQIGDNGGNNSQIKNGSFSVLVYAGGTLTINGYPGYTSYTLSDGTTTTEEITAEAYTYTAQADVEVTITPVSGNNYFYSFSITYSEVPEQPEQPEEPTTKEYVEKQNFTESGKESSFYAISGNIAKDKGTVEYEGLSLEHCLKMESSTSITFTAPASKLTLVFGGSTAPNGKTVKIDGTKHTVGETGILVVELEAGTHTITKGDSIFLYYMSVSYTACVEHTPGAAATCTEDQVCTECGIVLSKAVGHVGGSATCKDKAVCTACGEAYGELSTEHTGGTSTCTQGAVCDVCGKEYGAKEDHADEDADGKCDSCGTTLGDIVEESEMLTFADMAVTDGNSISKGSVVLSSDTISVKVTDKSCAIKENTATCGDLTFSKILLPSGGGGKYEITATKAGTVTIYFVITDSSLASKASSATIGDVTVTTAKDSSTAICYSITINVVAGETYTLSAEANRLAIYAVEYNS